MSLRKEVDVLKVTEGDVTFEPIKNLKFDECFERLELVAIPLLNLEHIRLIEATMKERQDMWVRLSDVEKELK